jgi:hypothetical protein
MLENLEIPRFSNNFGAKDQIKKHNQDIYGSN